MYAVDIESGKIDIIKNNCDVYNCKENIEIIHSDFLLLDKSKKVGIFSFISFIP